MISSREALLELFAYDMWANVESLDSIRRAPNAPERAVALIAHIPGTLWVWLERVRQSGKKTVVWPPWTLVESAQEIARAASAWSDLLGSANLGIRVPYANSRDEHFESSIADIATHVLFHGTYHRGQIATLLRQSGAEPAYTDYIHYARKIAGKA